MKNNKTQKLSTALLILFFLLTLCFFAELFLGAQKLDLKNIFKKNTIDFVIFFKLRMSRALLVLLTGIALGGSGAAFQMFFRNPLAEPGIMGISSGASLGAVIAACFASFTMNIGAFIGALCAGFLISFLSGKKSGKSSTVTLLLCGTALGTFYSALISIILTMRSNELRSIYNWMMGSFSGRGFSELKLIAPITIFSSITIIILARPLDMLSGGETTAASLGLQVSKLRTAVIIASSLAVSAAVCAGGTIGFVGLIAPHIVRKLFSAKGRILIPFSMITGGTILLFADTIARTVVAPSELPVGIVMSLFGAPFFISIIMSNKKEVI